jgi:simple sugar transport system permease protein
MLGTGINWYLGDPKVFNAARETVTLGTYKQAIAASITIGNTVFRIDWIMLFAIVLAFASWFIMFKTKIGLLIRYSGEEPALVDAMGYNIFLIRYIGVIISGFLAGIAGAYYVLALSGKWNAGPGGDSVLGWGFIAIGITVLSLWNPLYALGATLLFSSTKAMFFPLQRIVGEQNLMVLSLIQGIPYILAIVMLWIISILGLWRRLGIPRALGEPYSRE